jgi:hypothetical protein
MRVKETLILFLPFLCFIPCLIQAQIKGNKFFHMSLSGKIAAMKNEKFTSVLVTGYDDYIVLDCLTDDLSSEDSFYKPSNSVDHYRLFKKDSNWYL